MDASTVCTAVTGAAVAAFATTAIIATLFSLALTIAADPSKTGLSGGTTCFFTWDRTTLLSYALLARRTLSTIAAAAIISAGQSVALGFTTFALPAALVCRATLFLARIRATSAANASLASGTLATYSSAAIVTALIVQAACAATLTEIALLIKFTANTLARSLATLTSDTLSIGGTLPA